MLCCATLMLCVWGEIVTSLNMNLEYIQNGLHAVPFSTALAVCGLHRMGDNKLYM
jgi:hypothetical protein